MRQAESQVQKALASDFKSSCESHSWSTDIEQMPNLFVRCKTLDTDHIDFVENMLLKYYCFTCDCKARDSKHLKQIANNTYHGFQLNMYIYIL